MTTPMTTPTTTTGEIIQALNTDAHFLNAVQRAILPPADYHHMQLRLIALEAGNQRLDAKIDAKVDAATQTLRQEIQDATDTLQKSIDDAVAKIGGEISALAGSNFERYAQDEITDSLHHRFDLRSNHACSIPQTNNSELLELLLPAVEADLITTSQSRDIRRADIAYTGQDSQKQALQVLLEISITIEEKDIRRAQRRADWLELATGVPTRPAAAAGQFISPEIQLLADQYNVYVVMVEVMVEPED